ncbi:condensation domain-containing protein, partial [Cupriavidus pinatubonensis]|uniref:condensation domain-containing protein n=1 Tax=Cupriavidus pinatubonensis TaxID=248026 RepID=UPI002159C94E
MLFHTLDPSAAHLYINQTCVPVEGLDVPAFIAAWDQVVARHEILRTGFWSSSDLREPLQVVYKAAQVSVQIVDWRDRQVDADALQALAQDDCAKGFDMLAAPLTRLTLVHLDEHRHQLIWTSHHILMDGWSNAQLLGEVISHYAGQALPAPLGQFRDYLGWLQQQSSAADEAFWRASLAPVQAPTLLAEALRPPVDGAGMADHQAVLDSTLTTTLSEFARQQKITLNTLLQGAWSVLLQRYTGHPCVVFGATVAGRSAPLPGIEQQLGLFINTLPMISTPAPAQQAAAWLGELQALNLGLRDHEHVPLYDIQGWAGQQGAALFDTLLVFENFPVAEALKQGAPAGLSFGQLHNHERTNYPLTLGIELGSSLRLEFSYDRARFSEAQVAQLSANLQHLLVQLAADPGASLGSLQLLDEPGRRAMLGLSQSRAASTRHHGLVHERIAAQAQATPAALAVLAGSQRLSYGELN